ncbi:hypothetical protein SBA3_2120006 [Candidatus Sulfopaludibacter sp. SbA3]|nr:hypothetical protein SBA3_2120006 [Candidatus Sulfopaludibacter sp. SbA3]
MSTTGFRGSPLPAPGEDLAVRSPGIRGPPDRQAVSIVRLIRWTTEAADQFEAAVKHIQQDNPVMMCPGSPFGI